MALNVEKCADTKEDTDDFNAVFMELALKQAEIGKQCSEVPVGCVFVENNEKVIASAHNETNKTRNGTKHCEIVCMDYLATQHEMYEFSNVYLYVTVEPCIMCAAALKITNICKVFYACCNTKFGGNGSVYALHESEALGFPLECFSASYPSIKVGGKYEQSAIQLLKTFYETGNDSLPEDKRARKRIKLDTDVNENSTTEIGGNTSNNKNSVDKEPEEQQCK